jgi:pimeloyl-ACP methyl ester carboxylesterase
MGTPDGRRGWNSYLLEEGFRVYIVDRPGHGRAPFHPDLHGGFPAQHTTQDTISARFTSQAARQPNASQFVKLHTQWPGTGEIGSPELLQMVSGMGGSFFGPVAAAHEVWRKNGAELLDKIGPAIFITHSAGGPFGLLVAEVRPKLVKGLIIIESGGGGPFSQQNVWGLTTIPMTYDPPVTDPSQIKKQAVTLVEAGVAPYQLQEEPARRLTNIKGIPMVFVTAEASFASPGNPAAVAFINQAGGRAEELRLAVKGVRGNGHMMMIEKNNRQVLVPILDWIKKRIPSSGAQTRQPAKNGETAIKLADQGFFWVGAESKRMDYGTIVSGQMYVQYLIPERVRHPYPVVLVHGGAGQGTHYMGLGGQAGWAHYYVQEGYEVYIVDRAGHGRSVYHPDSLGAIGPVFNYASVTADFMRAANSPQKRWPGTGAVGDPLIDQFQAGQNSTPQDAALARSLWASRGAMLLDRIGRPVILQTHSAGGPFGWLVADRRPKLVKALVCFEGATGFAVLDLGYDPPLPQGTPLATTNVTPPGGRGYALQTEPARKLRNLSQVPICIVTAEASTRSSAEPVGFLRQAGCNVTDLQMKDKGILGNGHFMMFETNRREAFDVIRGWIEQTVKG